MSEVYVITNKINGKQYVGKTNRTSKERWKEHISEASRSKERPLYRALNKYGEEQFSVETYKSGLTEEEALELEVILIERFGTFKRGYNATIGGEGSSYRVVSEEDISKIISLYKNKYTIKEISEIMNCDTDTISRRLKENSVPIYKGTRSKWEDPIKVSKNGKEMYFERGQDFIIFIIENNLSKGTEESIKRGVSRLFDGTRKTYLKFTLIE